ncbi:MAG TPA: preprotein translocase subunit YajC [Candidatus Hydrogenedens sp.]|nr:preprotein translocase subunit YajC [Candidatus Hydrogenedens sp.]
MLPMILAFIAIMYFLMIRPQQKREKERREMLNSLAKGDKVVTTGGMYGTVVDLSEEKVTLRVDDKVEIDFIRGAVAQIVSKANGDKKK